jgi:hypothetical protein
MEYGRLGNHRAEGVAFIDSMLWYGPLIAD